MSFSETQIEGANFAVSFKGHQIEFKDYGAAAFRELCYSDT